MSRAPAKASSFLAAMNLTDEPAPPALVTPEAKPARSAPAQPAAKRGRPAKRQNGSRVGLKHIGAYVDDATAEKVALLKIRMKQGNDDLITAAIDALYRAENAKRKFGE